jgi:predicted DNA-binding ribbon-helix-helix protein
VHEGLPINALVARIDSERIMAATPPGLASAIRLWLTEALRQASLQPQAPARETPPD